MQRVRHQLAVLAVDGQGPEAFDGWLSGEGEEDGVVGGDGEGVVYARGGVVAAAAAAAAEADICWVYGLVGFQLEVAAVGDEGAEGEGGVEVAADCGRGW